MGEVSGISSPCGHQHLMLYHRRGSQELDKATSVVNMMLQEGKMCFNERYMRRNRDEIHIQQFSVLHSVLSKTHRL